MQRSISRMKFLDDYTYREITINGKTEIIKEIVTDKSRIFVNMDEIKTYIAKNSTFSTRTIAMDLKSFFESDKSATEFIEYQAEKIDTGKVIKEATISLQKDLFTDVANYLDDPRIKEIYDPF